LNYLRIGIGVRG